MKEHTITADNVQELFDYDPITGDLTWKNNRRRARAGNLVGSICGKGYRRTVYEGKAYTIHRIVWFLMEGYWPDTIDHIDGVKDNNRFDNLRNGTQMENNQNVLKPKGGGRLVGVTYREKYNHFRVHFKRNNETYKIPTTKDFFEAVCLRKSLEINWNNEEYK